MIETMQKIGRVKFVQVQRDSLKQGDRPNQRYLPAPLQVVERLRFTEGGFVGITDSGEEIVDVHHADHPNNHHRGHNAFSIGFTGNYGSMRDRFGLHLVDGIAGENIIVETSIPILGDDLGEQIAFQNPESGKIIELHNPRSMAPCEPFSRFALNQETQPEAKVMKATLQFLDNGRRGYVATLKELSGLPEISAGYILYISG